MADSISKERRSWNMSRIKSKDTSPELYVRSTLHQAGFRFRLHVKEMPGKPDIVLPKYKTVIFVHGCFWHRHPGCSRSTTPSSNTDYWKTKFERNVERDKKEKEKLHNEGWNVVIIWECEVKEKTKETISFLKKLHSHK